MPTLPTRSWSTVVSTIVAGIQGRCAALIDFSVGSPLLAIAEAFAGASLWLQWLILQVLQAARLSTAAGTDVDTFVGDFGLTRLPASFAGGRVTFSRFTASASVPFIPVGATVQTADGTQSFVVVADGSNTNFNPALRGYQIAANTTSVSVTVDAATPGTQANVGAGTISVITSPLTGVDTVVNGATFSGGLPTETDQALKARFALFILGLARGDLYGVESALANLNVAIKYTITDQYSYPGVFTPGYFYAVVDDGTGSPSSDFLAMARVAIDAVRPLGVWFGVFAPALVTANVSMILSPVLPGFTRSAVIAQVAALVQRNIVALGLGAGLDAYQIAAWVLSVPGVAPGGVTALLLNSASADAATIVANNKNRIMPGTIAVS